LFNGVNWIPTKTIFGGKKYRFGERMQQNIFMAQDWK